MSAPSSKGRTKPKKGGRKPKRAAVVGVQKRSLVPASWEELLRLVPGYDAIATGQAAGCVFDERAATEAIAFVEELCHHVEGHMAGQLIRLQPWQKAIFANLFGWKKPNGLRRFRKSLVYVPRKNGKTTICAPLVIQGTAADNEPGAQVYCAASDRDQASLVFSVSKRMVTMEPELARRIQIYESTKTLMHPESGSTAKAISSEAASKHGYNTHRLVVDELHAQPDRELVDVLVTSMGARLQPLAVFITTADFERESICNETLSFAERVRDGVIEDASFLPVIYAAGKDDDWTDRAVWHRVNPNLGVSVRTEYLEAEFHTAQEQPSFENTFKRLYLNMKTQSDVVWIPLEKWDQSGLTPGAQSHEDLKHLMKGRPCWGALDLSSTADLTSFNLYFPEESVLLTFPFIPEQGAETRERRDGVPYLTWARQGFIELTPGNVVDQRRIQARIGEIARDYLLQDIGIDPWNAAAITQGLMDDGFQIVEFRQGYQSMNAPAKEFEKLVMSGRLRHGGHPVLRWCVSNTMAESDPAGNIKPSKKKSTQRIDCVVGGVMAVGRAMAGQGGVSVYEMRGLIRL